MHIRTHLQTRSLPRFFMAALVASGAFVSAGSAWSQDETLSPRDYFRELLERQQKTAESNKLSAARRFWTDLVGRVKVRRDQLTQKQDSQISWKLSDTSDRLTKSQILTSTALIKEGDNRLRVEFTCSSLKKQLQVLLTDVSPATEGISDGSRNLANVSMTFDPPPLDVAPNQVRNTKMPFDGKSIIATGLNFNNWGISLCGADAGGAGYVFNAAYCSLTGLNDTPADIKDREWVRYPWLDFDEIRMSLQINWSASSSDGKQIKTSHFVVINPYAPNLWETLTACDRNENMCLGVSNEAEDRACRDHLERSIR